MDLNESIVTEEVTNFLNNLQNMLPKRKFDASQYFRTDSESLSKIHGKAKDVYPNCFVGARIVAVREIVGKVKLSQQYNYGYRKDPYRSFAHFLFKEMTPKIRGNGIVIESSGCATINYHDELNDGYDIKIQSKIQNIETSEVDLTIGKAVQGGFGSVTILAQDVDPQSVKIVSQYLHNVYQDVSIGAEMSACPLSAARRPNITVSARYTPPNTCLSTTVGWNGFQICFFKRLSRNLKFASILDHGNYSNKTTVSLALQNNFVEGARLKLFVDSNSSAGFTFEKDVFSRDQHVDVKVLRIVASTLVDQRRRVELGIGFYLDW